MTRAFLPTEPQRCEHVADGGWACAEYPVYEWTWLHERAGVPPEESHLEMLMCARHTALRREQVAAKDATIAWWDAVRGPVAVVSLAVAAPGVNPWQSAAGGAPPSAGAGPS